MFTIEYYVRYIMPPSPYSFDTKERIISSQNFLSLKRAEEFKKSMLSQGAISAEIKEMKHYE